MAQKHRFGWLHKSKYLRTMKITFIQTGGTIDKDYPKTKLGYAFEITAPAAHRILENANPSFKPEVITAFRKDSTEITLVDRRKLLKICKDTKNNKIIITHGTDTMLLSAKVLSVIKDKTIILTGAMRPEKFSNSDAPFNLGMAVGGVKVLPYGVYIAMHGQIIPWDLCWRNASGQFVSKV